MKTWKCYQCSYCCKQSACGYGKWNPKKHQCDYLNENDSCSKYSEIVEREKDSPMAMMGCGCSSPLLNTMRAAKMRALGISPEDEQKEIEKDLNIELDFGPDFDKVWEKICDKGMVHV